MWTNLYMHICVQIYFYIYIYVFIFINIYLYIHTYRYLHIWIRMCLCIYIYTVLDIWMYIVIDLTLHCSNHSNNIPTKLTVHLHLMYMVKVHASNGMWWQWLLANNANVDNPDDVRHCDAMYGVWRMYMIYLVLYFEQLDSSDGCDLNGRLTDILWCMQLYHTQINAYFSSYPHVNILTLFDYLIHECMTNDLTLHCSNDR
jgi:hypothetical protein